MINIIKRVRSVDFQGSHKVRKIIIENDRASICFFVAYLSRRGFEDPEAEIARTKKSETYRFALNKKRLEILKLAIDAGLPIEEVLIAAGYDEEERARLLPLMNLRKRF